MLEKLLERFGYVRADRLEQARYEASYEGRVDGQAEMQDQCSAIVRAVKAQYAGIERERDHLRKLIADNVALSHPPLITVRDESRLLPPESDPEQTGEGADRQPITL